MTLDFVAMALKVLEKAQALNVKLEKAWPHLKHMGIDAQNILTAFNNDKPLMMAGSPSTQEGMDLAQKLIDGGVNSTEAFELAVSLEAATDRIAA